jgi:hypothetical protein
MESLVSKCETSLADIPEAVNADFLRRETRSHDESTRHAERQALKKFVPTGIVGGRCLDITI